MVEIIRSKKYNPEIEAYTNLLMKCVSDDDFFDEGLVNYLLNYKREIIEDSYFINREDFGVIKSNLWGYIKNQNDINQVKLEKWARILQKDINEKATYQYIKFKYHDREKKLEYKPLYYKGYGSSNNYIEVSEEFLRITQYKYKRQSDPLKSENLTDTEMRLIMNDLFNDNNIDQYNKFKDVEGYELFIERIKNFIIENYKELDQLAKEEKKGLLRMISTGDAILNRAFQQIQGREREDFIEKNNLEEKFLTYLRYKDIGKDFLVHSFYNYKNKDFWIKNLKCYKKEENKFSINNAIQDFIKIIPRIDDMYENKTSAINWDRGSFMTILNESMNGETYKRVLKTLDFFKEELKGAINYKEEMKKLMIVAIGDKNADLYKVVKSFMINENGFQEDMEFKSNLYKETTEKRRAFLNKVKENEIKAFHTKLEGSLEEKGITEKKFKI